MLTIRQILDLNQLWKYYAAVQKNNVDRVIMY